MINNILTKKIYDQKNTVDAQMCLALIMKDCHVLNVYTVIMNYNCTILAVFSVIF